MDMADIASEVGAAGKMGKEGGVECAHTEDAVVGVVRDYMCAETAAGEGEGEQVLWLGDERDDLEEEFVWEAEDGCCRHCGPCGR